MQFQERQSTSPLDGTLQPFLFAPADSSEPRPLLVGLHSWSTTSGGQFRSFLPLMEELHWHLLLPDFRGPNLGTNPHCRQACGSVLAKQDVIDAVDLVRAEHRVSETFLLGGSGGAHMALLLSAYRPHYWTAVNAWCPITDLALWHSQNPRYTPHIEACCGGRPGTSAEVDAEYHDRSPISHLAALSKANVLIQHGKHDPSVPCAHSLDLYTRLNSEYPGARVYLEIFDGKHEFRLQSAVKWFQERTPKQQDSPVQEISG